MHPDLTARHWLAAAAPKALPALATSTVLILARIWNANGAEHSLGNAVLMGALALGSAAAGAFASSGLNGGDSLAASAAFGTAGTLAFAGVAGYSDGLSLPLLLWAVATVLAYVLAARHWRTDRREQAAHARHTTERRDEHAHVERVEAIRAQAQITTAQVQVDVAREHAVYAGALAEALTARAALPGYDPTALTGAGLPQLPTIVKEN
ncbi:hypothetical protein [Streptomyces sp. ODS28]|uniref:hypothetical protein n=1 Tax=Streptomyces sp. ODS28 TaxID=3136688 RepID=UPI0031E74B14